MKSIIVEKVIHKGESRIALRYSYDTETDSLVRSFPGARWSMTMKCWHVPDSPTAREKLVSVFGDRFSQEGAAFSGLLVDNKSVNASGDQREFPPDPRKFANQINFFSDAVHHERGF